MTARIFTIYVVSLLLFSLIPAAASQEHSEYYYNNTIRKPPRLYFFVEENNIVKPSLSFDYVYSDYYDKRIELHPNDSIMLSISGVRDRIFDPDFDFEVKLNRPYTSQYDRHTRLRFQLRFDNDGDGFFEYVIDFPETEMINTFSFDISPSNITGEPMEITNGTIELDINRTDNNEQIFPILCWTSTWIEIPFDLDSDSNGIGNYDDPDDDGDGYSDWDDAFPQNPDEWRDSDNDGIGNNEDDDNNGNNIPDDLEIPLAMGIVLIPLIVIMVVMNKFKKNGKEEEGEWGEEDIPILTTPHEGPKNW
jgi:hypothetical protein